MPSGNYRISPEANDCTDPKAHLLKIHGDLRRKRTTLGYEANRPPNIKLLVPVGKIRETRTQTTTRVGADYRCALAVGVRAYGDGIVNWDILSVNCDCLDAGVDGFQACIHGIGRRNRNKAAVGTSLRNRIVASAENGKAMDGFSAFPGRHTADDRRRIFDHPLRQASTERSGDTLDHHA